MNECTLHLPDFLANSLLQEEPIRASRKIKKVTRKKVKELAKQFTTR